MKRRNADCGKLRRPVKRNKITEGMYGSNTFLYIKFLVLWAIVITADFMLEFRFEFLWPFWLLLRSVHDSFKYKGLAFSVLFVCIAVTSDLICLFFIPVHWLFFAASTYVWVQYVWHTDKGICLPTIFLWMLFVYLEAAIRWKDSRHMPHLDLCRPFAAHCIGYPVVTLGFGFKSYVGYRIRQRKQREVAKENEFYMQLLQQALPQDESQQPHQQDDLVAAATTANNTTTTTHQTDHHIQDFQKELPLSNHQNNNIHNNHNHHHNNHNHHKNNSNAQNSNSKSINNISQQNNNNNSGGSATSSTTPSTANGHITSNGVNHSNFNSNLSTSYKNHRRSMDKDTSSKGDTQNSLTTTTTTSSTKTTDLTSSNLSKNNTASYHQPNHSSKLLTDNLQQQQLSSPSSSSSSITSSTSSLHNNNYNSKAEKEATANVNKKEQTSEITKDSKSGYDYSNSNNTNHTHHHQHHQPTSASKSIDFKNNNSGSSNKQHHSTSIIGNHQAESVTTTTTTTTAKHDNQTSSKTNSNNNYSSNDFDSNNKDKSSKPQQNGGFFDVELSTQQNETVVEVVEKVKGRRNRSKQQKESTATNHITSPSKDNHHNSNSANASANHNDNNTAENLQSSNQQYTKICESCIRLETEMKKCKSELGQLKHFENELRQKCESNTITKSNLNAKQKENDELEKKLQEIQNSRQIDRQTMQSSERRFADERRQKQSLESQLNAERKQRKLAEEKAARSECGEACKHRKLQLDAECKQLRRELSSADEAKKSAEQQSRNYEQELLKYEAEYRSREGTEVLMSALAAMQDKNSTLEKNLSAETRVKLDLFSALGEAKRQLEIRESMVRTKDKEVLELKAKIAQLLAVMPSNESFCMPQSAGGSSMLRLNDASPLCGQGPSSPMPHKSLGGSPLISQLQSLSSLTASTNSMSSAPIVSVPPLQQMQQQQLHQQQLQQQQLQQQQLQQQQLQHLQQQASSQLDPNATVYTPKNVVGGGEA